MTINPQAFGQQTPATQFMLAKLNGRRGGRKSARKRRKTKASAAPRRRTKVRRKVGKRRARLVKGSAAAKRYMAKIRRKRR